ncbi:MAG: AmmeMemoRadiSam system protein A [Bacteroidota bacterium]
MKTEKELFFNEREKGLMLKIARDTLFHYLNTGKILDYDPGVLPDSLLNSHGVFVSLHKGRALRGCLGVMQSDEPLFRQIQHQVIAASDCDTRFKKVKFSELQQLCIEITILQEMKKIKSIDEIQLGKHGIYIKSRERTGTMLPQVAETTGWTVEEFLGYCSRDKADIGWDGWKSADLFIYSALVFSEKDLEKY